MINLSKYKFTVYEFQVLGYNLNFIPTPKHLNTEQLKEDLKQFGRKMKLRAHFGNTGKFDLDDESIRFRPPSNKKWIPQTHHTVDTFLEAFQSDIDQDMKSIKPHNPHHNLSKYEQKALASLSERTDIIIINADKGGAVTILNIEDYINDANKQLNDPLQYKELIYDPTVAHAKTINDTIDLFKAQQKLPKQVAEGLKCIHPKTPSLRLPPKVHKPNHPGRPIVSSIDSHSSKISEYVDFHLQPEVPKIKSYIKDTNDFLNQLEKVPADKSGNSYLVTLDVRSLYSNIPNEEGVNIIKETLQKAKSKVTSVIIAFLWLILTLNNFTFNGKHFLQLLGVAMGTKCSAAYANLFMSHFEETYIYPIMNNNIDFYKRFIDDIFLLWNGTLEQLNEFLNKLNTLHPTIKFDAKYSYTTIDFLDTNIYKANDGKLCTTLHTKPTDRQSYLHRKSYHPAAAKRSIAYSQALRIRRICTEDKEFNKHSKQLLEKLTNRGYNKPDIEEIINKVSNIDREELLKPRTKQTDGISPIIVTFNKNLPNIKNAMRNNWNILHINNDVSEAFPQQPNIAFRKNRNLRQILCKHKLFNNKIVKKETKIGKCRPCLSRRDNLCCKQMECTTFFTNRKTGKRYNILHNLNCKSSNVIYLIECTLCDYKPYVGKSEPPSNIRTNNHRADSAKENSIPVDKHFGQPGHNFTKHARITLIEQMRNTNKSKEEIRNILERREDFWIIKLDSMHPNGFNQSLNFPQ